MSQMPWEHIRPPLISLTCSKQLLTTSKTLYFAVFSVRLPPAASGAPQVHWHDAGRRQKLSPTPGEGFWTKIFTPIASLKQQEPFPWNENMRVEARNYMIFDVNAVLHLLNYSIPISFTRPSVLHCTLDTQADIDRRWQFHTAYWIPRWTYPHAHQVLLSVCLCDLSQVYNLP